MEIPSDAEGIAKEDVTSALDPEHRIRSEFAERAAQLGHWVQKEIARIHRGEVCNFDDLHSLKVVDPAV